MIDGLKPYPDYKESGSRWLGAVPAHWQVRNLRTLITKRTERERPDLPLLSVAREKGVFVRSLTDEDENHNVIPEDLTNYKVARTGDLVINKMKAWQGSMGIAPCDGIVSPAYFVFDFRISNHGFGQALLRSKPYVAHFGQASDGVRVGQWDLSIPGMRQIPVLVPDPDEQAAIVRFLDHANGRIERAIRAKQKLMALLNEQKQAIIHRAVTRGLNPNVPLKPSGIPWLGNIPEHWEVKKLRLLFRYAKGSRAAELTNTYIGRNAGAFPVYSGQTERGGLMGEINWHEFEFDSPVIFVSTVGARAMSTRLVQGKFSLSQNCALIIPRTKEANPVYFESVFQRLFDYEKATISLIMQPSLRFADLNRFYVPQPPLPEQILIAETLTEKIAELEQIINRTEREIGLLREYRTRLVADVVTGKLDVRAAARHLPAATTEPETNIAAEDLPEEAELEPAEAAE